MANQSVWYVHINGEQRGPLSAEAVRQAMAQGSVTAKDWAWREGLNDWCQIFDLAEFDPPPAKPKVPPRWRIWKAIVYGLVASAITMAINYDEFLQSWYSEPTHIFVSGAIGYIAAAPLLFTLIALMRNLIVCRRP